MWLHNNMHLRFKEESSIEIISIRTTRLYDTCAYPQESFITLIVSLQCDFFHTRFLSSTQRQCLDCLTCVLLHWSSFIVLHVSSLIDNHDWMCYIVKTLLRGLSYMCPPCLTLSSTLTWRCLVNTPQSKRTHARQSKRTHVRQWRRTHVTREIKVLKSQGFKEECLMNIVVCHLINIICCSVLQCVAVCCHIQYHQMKINNLTCSRMSTPWRGNRTQWPSPTQHPPSHAHTPPHSLTTLYMLCCTACQNGINTTAHLHAPRPRSRRRSKRREGRGQGDASWHRRESAPMKRATNASWHPRHSIPQCLSRNAPHRCALGLSLPARRVLGFQASLVSRAFGCWLPEYVRFGACPLSLWLRCLFCCAFGCLVDCLFRSLVACLIGIFFCCLVNCLFGCLDGSLVCLFRCTSKKTD